MFLLQQKIDSQKKKKKKKNLYSKIIYFKNTIEFEYMICMHSMIINLYYQVKESIFFFDR